MDCVKDCISINETIEVIIDECKRGLIDISSSDEVVSINKGMASALGLAMPAKPESSVVEYKLLTLNFPRDQKLRLNKKMNYKYIDYKTLEQKIICDRIKHLLDNDYGQCLKYNIYYEYCKDGNLHVHLLLKCNCKVSNRDLTIDVKRFYGISTAYFCDVRDVNDLKYVQEYLTDKKTKSYQTTGIEPCVNF